MARFTREPGRNNITGYAVQREQRVEEERGAKLIMADVLRRMRQAGDTTRAQEIQSGRMPEDKDLEYFAAHVGGIIEWVPLGCANVQGPTSIGTGTTK